MIIGVTLCAAGMLISTIASCGIPGRAAPIGLLWSTLILATLTACTSRVVASVRQTTAIVGAASPSAA